MSRRSGARAFGRLMGYLLRLALLAPVALLAVVAIAATAPAHAAASIAADGRRASASPAARVTVIVLDMSGSMGGSNGSDPQGLRCSAADAYISLSGSSQFIGVVGLVDPSGAGQAQVWAPPAEMSTLQAREQLIKTISDKSNHCQAHGGTPTYDALSKAYDMLAAATKGGRVGSAILLTDGVPDPNQEQQTNDIIHNLVPKFAQAGYPINTIALGSAPEVRPFLRDISSGTNGSFDDDVNPDTGRPDPLQIAPVFLRFFAALTGRTPKQLASERSLNGGVTQQDFFVSDLEQHLDVVVVKQDAGATVTLISPDHNRFTHTTASVLVATDPHYAIFSIDGPTKGEWIASISGGSGNFSIYGLVVTNLRITLTQPGGTRQAFPIDQALAIQARLVNGVVDVNSSDYTVTGELTSGSEVVQQIILKHVPGSATYTGSIGLPTGKPSGTYDLTLYVRQGTKEALASSTPRPINFENFPTPFLLDASGVQATAVTTTVTRFDPALQRIYSLPVLSWSWISGLPLAGIPATPSAVINGVVTLHGKAYANATVSGSAARSGQSGAAAASVSNTGAGHFQVIFPAVTDGAYALNLDTSGAYQDSHGAFGETRRQVTLSIVPATVAQEGRAWGVTGGYALLLVVLSPVAYRWFLPRRTGRWTLGGGRARGDSGSFYRQMGRRRYLRRWFKPNEITSSELWGFPGLLLVWRAWGRSEIRPDGAESAMWTPSRRGTVVGPLTYKPGGGTDLKIDITAAGARTRGIGMASVTDRRAGGFGGSRRAGFGGPRSGGFGRPAGGGFGRPSGQTRARGGFGSGAKGASGGFGRSGGQASGGRSTAGARSTGGSRAGGFGRPR